MRSIYKNYMPKIGERYHSTKYKDTFTVSKLYHEHWDYYGSEQNNTEDWIQMKDKEGKVIPASLTQWRKALAAGRLILIEEGELSEVLYG